MKSTIAAALAVAILAVPAAGFAQEEGLEGKIDVQLQGGIGGWTGVTTDATGNVGPYYGVLGAYNQTDNIAFEAGFQGISNDLSGPSQGRMTANRIQGDVKASLPLEGPVAWRPYAFAGLAFNLIGVGDDNAFGYNNTLQTEVPIGVGADFFTDSFIHVGARGTFNWSTGLGGEMSVDNEHPSSWQAGLTASASF